MRQTPDSRSSCSSSRTPSCEARPAHGSRRSQSSDSGGAPMAADHYDVIVIGSGAGGGTTTYALAPTGKRILLLERGDWYPRERDNWDSRVVWGDLKYRNAGHWTDQNGKEFNPKQHYYVGGNTKVYGAVLFRMRERDFRNVHHVDGISPEWPLT